VAHGARHGQADTPPHRYEFTAGQFDADTVPLADAYELRHELHDVISDSVIAASAQVTKELSWYEHDCRDRPPGLRGSRNRADGTASPSAAEEEDDEDAAAKLRRPRRAAVVKGAERKRRGQIIVLRTHVTVLCLVGFYERLRTDRRTRIATFRGRTRGRNRSTAGGGYERTSYGEALSVGKSAEAKSRFYWEYCFRLSAVELTRFVLDTSCKGNQNLTREYVSLKVSPGSARASAMGRFVLRVPFIYKLCKVLLLREAAPHHGRRR
jgi:hypothetical protein